MTESSPTPEGSRGISRRAVAKTAAWSAPVILAAVAAPVASASVLNWNIAVSGGCLASGGTGSLVPTWTIQETTGNTPAPALLFHEELTETFTSTLTGALGLAQATAAIPVLAAYFATQAPASFVHLNWPTNSGVLNVPPMNIPNISGIVPTRNPNGTYTFSIKLTRDNITLAGLSGGGTARYSYPVSLVPPNVPGIGLTSSWSLTALPGSGGSVATDDTGALSNALIVGGC